VVGETRTVHVQAEQAPDLDHVKAGYRRPDTIPFPHRNPYTPQKARLGHMLYNDPRLSDTGTLSCASCHNPGFAYGDGLQKAIGLGINPGDRRSPSIADSAWGELFMWDGRAASLEEQAISPIINPTEMNSSVARLIRTLSGIDGYTVLFSAAFPHEPITPSGVADAIATYERTVVTGFAPFDAWIDGDSAAISDAAKRGFDLFTGKAGCAACHSGWAFTDNGFHDIGLSDNDLGRGGLQPRVVEMQHAFKTPSLRDTTERAPYMHNGSLPTLEAVVARYNQGGVARPSRSTLVGPLGLSSAEQADIVAFLRTLTSPAEPAFIPALPR
jgi:cytochrome c peroxidase